MLASWCRHFITKYCYFTVGCSSKSVDSKETTTNSETTVAQTTVPKTTTVNYKKLINFKAEHPFYIKLTRKRTLPLFTALTRKVNIQFLTRLSFVQPVVRTILHLMVLLPFQKNIVGD